MKVNKDLLEAHDYAYGIAFAELNEACSAMRALLVTLKRFKILKPDEVQPLFKALRQKYFYAHMNRHCWGEKPPLYLPSKKSEV
jgi:uncharacterized membrane protein